jgi:hypothetical protein
MLLILQRDLIWRDQLVAASDDIRRQIEVLQAGPRSVGPAVSDFTGNASLISGLHRTSQEIEEALARLEPESPTPSI